MVDDDAKQPHAELRSTLERGEPTKHVEPGRSNNLVGEGWISHKAVG
jgi:hypothetical protein